MVYEFNVVSTADLHSYSTILTECAELFSNHYGTWSSEAGEQMKGKSIKLSAQRLRQQHLGSNIGLIAYARCAVDNSLVGHALASQIEKNNKTILWITQLVVHKNHRRKNVATSLIRRLCEQIPNHHAWGLCTANPFTIRALEKATHRTVDLQMIAEQKGLILQVMDTVPFLKQCDKVIDGSKSLVKSHYFVQQDLQAKLASCTSAEQPWTIGELEEHGDEWIACTFAVQSCKMTC